MHFLERWRLEPRTLNANLSKLRNLALNALELGLSAINPEKLINDNLYFRGTRLEVNGDSFDLNQFQKVHVIGAGKAILGMLVALEKRLLDVGINAFNGVINVPKGSQIQLNLSSIKVTVNEMSHPLPDESTVKATSQMVNILRNSSDQDLVICLFSGGGSSLLVLPRKGITIESLRQINSLLLASGASIQEINIVRKFLSKVKGGKLAQILSRSSKATMISLIISDVLGDDLQVIASGPTIPNQNSPEDALNVLEKYDLAKKIPKKILKILQRSNFEKMELSNNIHNYLIGSVKDAVVEIARYLNINGFKTVYFSDQVSGEARKYGRLLLDIMLGKARNFPQLWSESLALIGSGELTVTVKGDGIGGRNQEMLLSFLEYALEQEIKSDFLVMAINFDGLDGNSNAMGALIDNQVVKDALKFDLKLFEYLKNNNSNLCFRQLGTDIITGLTGCNVNDMLLVLIPKK
ncbi:MAG: DUF4147 domain-containing protein [Candidatus Lokiarchaeota archaeon]|nr:DUF4147 domain-containing protein [Candidatus Lokiarchaeota archaeon]